MTPPFSLRVLGDPVLLGPGGPVRGRAAYRRRIALLAVLAAARGRPVGRERLVGLLWPEHPGDSARRILTETLYVLRKELGEDTFVSVGDEVALGAGVVRSDLEAFEDAIARGDPAAAVEAYGGPFLDGFYVADAPDFERWAEGERDRLARALAGALEALAARCEAAGDLASAAGWWRRVAAQDPFSSRAALRLARALAAAGERGEAIRMAGAHAALLREELGVEPDPELAAFVEELRRRPEPAPRPAPADPAPAPPSASPSESESASGSGSGPGYASASASEPLPSGADEVPGPEEKEVHREDLVSPAEPSRRAPPRWRWAVGAALAGAVVLAAAMGLARDGAGPAAEPAVAAHDPRRIAVLYFDDHSAGGELGYLADGLTEMLIHELSQVSALDVVSRNAVKAYRDGRVPLDSLLAQLRVGTVVEGSVQRDGDTVRVAVQLIDAASHSHLESRVVARPASGLFALQDGVAEEVSRFLRRRLGREVQRAEAGMGTRSEAALRMVLQAERLRDEAAALRTGGAAEPGGALLDRADSLLARAERADPAWARPALERGWLAIERRGAAGAAEAGRRAADVLERAPADPAALELRANAAFLRGVTATAEPAEAQRLMEAAERDLRAAVAAEPSRASAWAVLSQLLRMRGRAAEADLAARRALEEDAYLHRAEDVHHQLYSSALVLERYAEAAELCARGARHFPGDWRFRECALTLLREDRSLPPDTARAWALVAELERLDPAERAGAEGRAYSPLYRRAVAASISARAGDAARARAELAALRQRAAGDTALATALAYDEAYLRLVLGEREEALRLLDGLVAARPALRGYLARDPLFRELLSGRGTSGGTSGG